MIFQGFDLNFLSLPFSKLKNKSSFKLLTSKINTLASFSIKELRLNNEQPGPEFYGTQNRRNLKLFKTCCVHLPFTLK